MVVPNPEVSVMKYLGVATAAAYRVLPRCFCGSYN